MKSKLFIALIILLIISEALYLLLYSSIRPSIILYCAVSVINSAIFVLCWIILRKIDLSVPRITYTVITAAIIFRLTVLFVFPTASDDINRYIWDGKVITNGINPYRYAPNDPQLNYLHSQTLPANVNFPSMKTIYPPLAQMVFFTSYSIFGESMTGFKSLLLLFEILTIILLYFLLKELKIAIYYLALYALCPLPIMQFMVDGHIDALGLSILILSLLLFFKGKRTAYYFTAGLSISTKLISGMILPFTVDKLEKRYLRKLIFAIIPVIIFALSYLPFLSDKVFPFESLGTFTTNWAFNGSAFNMFYSIIPDNQKARLISAMVFLLYGLYLFFSKREIKSKIYLMFFAFLLLSPTVHPWYVTWLAVLLPICFNWSGLAFVCLISLANFVVIDYKMKGIWQQDGAMLWMEYLPVYGLFIWEEIRSILISKHITKLHQ